MYQYQYQYQPHDLSLASMAKLHDYMTIFFVYNLNSLLGLVWTSRYLKHKLMLHSEEHDDVGLYIIMYKRPILVSIVHNGRMGTTSHVGQSSRHVVLFIQEGPFV